MKTYTQEIEEEDWIYGTSEMEIALNIIKKINRSAIGKKAYKTFMKNGGSRNSKGQFSKKHDIYNHEWIVKADSHDKKYYECEWCDAEMTETKKYLKG